VAVLSVHRFVLPSILPMAASVPVRMAVSSPLAWPNCVCDRHNILEDDQADFLTVTSESRRGQDAQWLSDI